MNDRYPLEEDDYYQKYYTYGRKRLKVIDKLRSGKPKINIILFFATYASTILTGWVTHGYWQAGLWYGTSIILILLAHEMGHYLMCRKYGIQATLPFFLPFPVPFLNPFGTFGAVIKMESRIPSRRALFDVAVAGPLAGLALTIPSIYFGIQLSKVVQMTPEVSQGTIYLGESFLFAQLSKLAIGTLPEGTDVMLHPLAFAGWAGLFVTALNLLPIGQLDGGHVVYALLGRRHNFIATAALVAFGLICIFIYQGWFLLLLLLIWFGHRHPPTLDETPLDDKRIAIGIITLIIFVLSFTPEPFKF
jgi:membrane-associated protease RseP (regulator of RpoE activity)